MRSLELLIPKNPCCIYWQETYIKSREQSGNVCFFTSQKFVIYIRQRLCCLTYIYCFCSSHGVEYFTCENVWLVKQTWCSVGSLQKPVRKQERHTCLRVATMRKWQKSSHPSTAARWSLYSNSTEANRDACLNLFLSFLLVHIQEPPSSGQTCRLLVVRGSGMPTGPAAGPATLAEGLAPCQVLGCHAFWGQRPEGRSPVGISPGTVRIHPQSFCLSFTITYFPLYFKPSL